MTDTTKTEAHAEAERLVDDVCQKADALLGDKYFDLLDENASADAFWDVVAPMVSAIGVVDPAEAGFADGKNIETALEVLIEVVRLRRKHGDMH